VVGGGSLTPHGAPRRWSAAEIYRWHPRRWEHFVPGMPSFGGLELGAAAPVRGAMMCVWEQRDGTAVVHLRERLPAFAERCWHPDSGRSLADFAARAARADALAQVLLGPGADGDADDHADDHADEWAALQRSGPARVRCRLYAAPPAGFETVPDFAALTPYATGTLPLLRGGPTAGPLGLVLTATLRIETAGEHWFRLESCDGLARLWLGDQLVCEQTRRSDWQGVEAKVALTVGDVPLRIDCAQGVFHTLCRVQWRPPGAAGFTLVDPALRVLE
jgi:hypothetical protein